MIVCKDRNGITFNDHPMWLPDRVSDWKYHNVRCIEAIPNWMDEQTALFCWWCERLPRQLDLSDRLEVHHLFAGSRGRSDQAFLFTLLCSRCHRHEGQAVTEDALPYLLYLKWQIDRIHTDWPMMAARYGRSLPDLKFERPRL